MKLINLTDLHLMQPGETLWGLDPFARLDAAHHARELTSVSQVMYTLIRVLHGYLNNDEQVRNLLSSGAIYWLPVVNYDGYAKISRMTEHWNYRTMTSVTGIPTILSDENNNFTREFDVDFSTNMKSVWEEISGTWLNHWKLK